jgi:hypothetical protein
MASVTFPVAQGGNGLSYADEDMLNLGYVTRFVPMLAQTVLMAQSAAASAAAASAGAANLSGTSSTSTTVGTGSKTFTATTGKSWIAGGWVIVFRTSAVSTYMLGRVTAYNSGTGSLTVDVTGTSGAGAFTDWSITVAGPQGATGSVASVGESSLSSNTTLGTGDRGKVVRCTSTFTLSFTAVATLTAGWWLYVHNEGTGSVTLDPNASELIDGLATYVMYPGEARLIWVNAGATALETLILAPFSVLYTSGVNTFTKPPGYTAFRRRGRGGGGGGGKSGSASFGAGGGGGGAGFDEITLASEYGATETVTIGAAGAATASAGPGGVGGNTSVGSLRIAYGGGGGGGNGSANHYPGTGGGLGGAGVAGGASAGAAGAGLAGNEFTSGHNSTVVDRAFGGGVGGSHFTNASGSWHGGPGGGGRSSAGADRPPAASLDSVGGASGDASSGAAGTGYGAGGGGTRTGASSGAGTAGYVQISGVF